MSTNNQTPAAEATPQPQPQPDDTNEGGGDKAKPKTPIKRVRKPKIKFAPNSVLFGVQASAPVALYGPCTFEMQVVTDCVVGTDEQAQEVRNFCSRLGAFPTCCAVSGYGIKHGSWNVTLDLATERRDANAEHILELSRQLKETFDATPVLKAELGFGEATFRVMNGGTTVAHGDLYPKTN